MDNAFIIEESLDDNSLEKTDFQTAIYKGKFDEYIIKASQHINGFFVITDTIKDRDSSDLIGPAVKTLVFSDCTKSFDEIKSENMVNLTTKPNLQKELAQDEPNLDDKFEFGKKVNLSIAHVNDIEILIHGFDETNDSFVFDPNLFPQDTIYKYSISKNEFKASMQMDASLQVAREFIDTFCIKTSSPEQKSVTVIINGIYMYEIFLGSIDKNSPKEL
ncbi:hypothetical protein CIG11343_0403 [Campylobacter iguaniorum]|uniref:DUF5416 family protein n=1 Tax=Campylobacter iguaniorum TaxID=1244531 RepID=UPI0007C968E5|nr:DUF5416 family protein [Campylobacter iguaniorum]ANE35485.1 hypothetical protein CIG11343_0403 [Campylobacter iguaniorum]